MIALVAFATRFWNLDGTADIVFDEVYYPKFAQNYLRGEPLFDAHPPLGKYIIALGIQLFGYAPFGYRCMTALAGALLPLVTYELVWQLSDRRSWAWLTGWFVAMDGLLLVESRFGLINIYILLFGMLSHLCMVLALKRSHQRWFWVIATGLMLGASFSIKWTGLAYVVGLIAIAIYISCRYRQALNIPQILFGLLLIPIAFYFLQWLPHLWINPERDIWELHRQIFGFHQNLGIGKAEPVHPYCSPWWSWIFLLRPVAYFFENRPNNMVEFVHAMGNPFLYWLSTIAIAICTVVLAIIMLNLARQGLSRSSWWKMRSQPQAAPVWFMLYVTTSFFAHWLPWSVSRRCIFLYHYMPASVFAFATLALLVSLLWRSPTPSIKSLKFLNPLSMPSVGTGIWILITASFLFWSPLYIGLPISSVYMRVLMWLTSWI